MTKSAIAKSIQDATSVSSAIAYAAAGCLIEDIVRHLVKTGHYMIPGIGTLTVTKIIRKRFVNPRTQEEFVINGVRRTVKFRVSPALRKKISGKRPVRATREPKNE